jgi:hypothetical protein
MTTDTRPYWVHSDPNTPSTIGCLVCVENHPVDGSFLCGYCFGRLRRNVSILVGAYGWLGVAMRSPAPAFRDGSGRSAPASRPPFDVGLHDLRDDITFKLRSWARVIAEEHQLRGPSDGDVRTVAAWIKPQLSWVSDQPWCDDMATEFDEAVRAARGRVPWERICRSLPLPCPGRYGCNLLTLAVYGGDDAVTCRNVACGRVIPWAEYWTAVKQQHLALTALPSQTAPLTITGAAA